jgi:PII-like signaling protein
MNNGVMKTIDVLMVRVYLTEAKAHLKSLMKRLNDEGKVRGVTVFRGIAGFGKSGHIHSSSLLDMSLDLPVVVEFFDVPAKAQSIIEELYHMVGPDHIVSWAAEVAVGDDS